ncbi:hypothetical protein FUAX_41030 (plasmid) [Fulvitalea axinellae]|uniref:DUF3164 family protein n=1 Tax=Fulvitalea axinellae TaxID=1182444 RepID=A0AAU9CR81_9BACT|nr:hypothetical protein FUAX_41030 [Fulvitalea axinellae]
MEKMDLSAMSAEELRKALAEREKAENREQEKREKSWREVKDAFVTKAVGTMREISGMMRDFKGEAVSNGNALHKEMYEVFGKKEKEGLKQFSLVTEDGMMKLVIDRQERQELDETATVAIETIKEVFRAKFAVRNKTMYNILDGILVKNKKGDYDERLVAKLRKFEGEVDDREFSEALDQLSKSYNTVGSSTYMRAYVWDKERERWDDVPMAFSRI